MSVFQGMAYVGNKIEKQLFNTMVNIIINITLVPIFINDHLTLSTYTNIYYIFFRHCAKSAFNPFCFCFKKFMRRYNTI